VCNLHSVDKASGTRVVVIASLDGTWSEQLEINQDGTIPRCRPRPLPHATAGSTVSGRSGAGRYGLTIVRTNYRRKRPPKRKTPVAIPMRIVTARKPGPIAPAIGDAVIERKRPAQAAAITGPRIVTAKPKRSTRVGPVQEMDAEEHQRRGDAGVELFRELVRRAEREN
jgi:hypothetical protein